MRRDTKQILLDKGLDAFFSKGYNNTGIQEVLAAAKVPKGSFYHYFRSKEDFGVQVIEHYGAQSENFLRELFESDNGQTPLMRLRSFFDAGLEMCGSAKSIRGCLIGNMSQEMGSLCPAFDKVLEHKWRTVRFYLSQCLSQAREQGEIGNQESAEDLADFLINGWQGAMMRVKVVGSVEPLENFIRLVFARVIQVEQVQAA